MTDNKTENKNFFQNPFASKPKPVSESEPIPNENKKEESELLDYGKDNALQHLIFHSFYLAAWPVPLEDNLIKINETVPDLMKATNHDPLLQETIKTFHEIMKEKDDEILNLRRQINNDSLGNLVEVQSEITQTDLTLEECNEMERQITLITADLPEKNERIYQLQRQLSRQNTLADANEQILLGSVSKPKESKIEEDLEDAYKNLTELEETNASLQKQLDELAEKHKLLQFQFADVDELKIEIENAKVQTENDLIQLKDVLEKKDLELKQVNERLTVLTHSDSNNSSEDLLNENKELIPIAEVELERKSYEEKIDQLTKTLNESKTKTRPVINKTYSQRGDVDIDDVIDELKEKIYNESQVSRLLPFLPENLITDYALQRCSDKEILSELIKIGCEDKTTESELAELVPILKSIAYLDNGNIDIEKVQQNIPKFKSTYGKLNKEQLVQEGFNIGLQMKIKENVSKLDTNNLKKEFMKLENILNIINNVFKLTPLRILNRMNRNELIDGIIVKMATILDISMHTFWDVILNKQLQENEVNKSVILTDADKQVVCNSLFHRFENANVFMPIATKLMNVRSLLLYGELSIRNRRENVLFFMKLYSLSVTYDIINHILPKYPKEIRCRLIEASIEDSIVDLYKIHENINPEFISLLVDSNKSSSIVDPSEAIRINGFSWVVLDILSILNFEDELFITLANSSKLEFPGHTLTLSSITKKIERSLIKVSFQKNIKNKLIEHILKIQFILNKDEVNSISESYASKSELELSKILIKKKESLLKLIFKDSFSPQVEKMVMPKGFRYLSCVSKEKQSLDFWVKLVLDKYHKEQMKELQSLTEEELQICLKRLLKAMEIVCPHLLEEYKENKTNKKDFVRSIFSCRNIIIRKLQECFIGRRCKLQLCQEVQELLQGVKINNGESENKLEIIKNHFAMSTPNTDLIELNDVLKRLYDIDCELFPGIPNVVSKDSRKLKAGEMLEEIMYLRLAISSSMVFMTGSWEDLKHTIESDIDRWNVMKKIECVIFNADLVEIDKDLIDTERNLLMKILKNCKRFKVADEDKLRKAFMEVKQISCRNMAETFDMTDNMKYYDKITTKGGKIQVLCGEIESIINSFKRKFETDETDDTLADKYIKLEVLLEDMENNLSEKNRNFQQSWIYSLYEKVKEIKTIISNDEGAINSKDESMRRHIVNDLQDIKQWVINTRDLQTKSFNRLNNAVRTLNNSSHQNERKVKLSSTEVESRSDNLNDEMKAFEKSFADLEERIREIDNEKSSNNNYGKMIEVEIMNISEEDLKRLILSLKAELAETSIEKYDTKEIEEWLSNRSKEQLREDCQNLAHKMLVKKLNDFLNGNSSIEIARNYVVQESSMPRHDNDLNSKLMKFDDVYDSVERSKVSQLYSKDKTLLSAQTHREVYASPQDKGSVRDPTQSYKFRKSNFPQNEDQNIDFYYQRRLGELQNYTATPINGNVHSRDPNSSLRGLHNSEVLVDGFEIEDEKTSRYYSMRLQDIQHERKEDELGAILHHMEQQRIEILDKNKNLQQQVFMSQSVIQNLQKKIDYFEKAEETLKQKKRAESNEMNNNDTRSLRDETKWLSGRLLAAQQQLDHQNTELINLSMFNDDLQHDITNLSIKNKYLNRSFQRLETIYEDLCRQLESSKPLVFNERPDFFLNMKESDLEKMLRQSENDKMELVNKLDILDAQNKLLKEHCEKLDVELLTANKNLSDSQSLAENYLKQAKQLTDMLDGMQYENERYQKIAISPLIKGKDEEIKRLKIKIQQLENKLMLDNQI